MPQQSNEGGADQRSNIRLRFDPTINAGHILTMAALAAAGFAAFNSLDKRTALVEQAQTQTAEAVHDLKADVKNVQTTVNDIRLRAMKGDRQ